MRIPTQPFKCHFYEFTECRDVYEADARDPAEAAVQACGWWEESGDDYRILRGEDTLRVRVEAGTEATFWEVGADRGRYLAKPIRD